MNHIELFAGIGGFRQGMNLIEKDFQKSFQCVGFSEIDKNAIITYKANYNTSGEIEMGDIVAFNSNISNIKNLDFELLTGGFPCQPFSMMGQQQGFDDTRGTMFFEIEKILKVKKQQQKPVPFVLLENVKNLYTHDNGNTFKVIKSRLEKLGYKVFSDIFNTSDFGLAQKRNRVYIFATTKKVGKDFDFTSKKIASVFDENLESFKSLFVQKNVLDVLEKKVDSKYFLSDKLKPTILANGSANFVSNSKINQIIARPLTATMHKMHRACQDNYYSQEFLNSKNPLKYLEKEFSKEEEAKHHIRKLTPEEAFNLQGFPKDFCKNARMKKVADGQLYRQAGNAVSVNVVYAILYYLFINQNLA